MGVGMIGPYRFRIDPSLVSWDFAIKAVDTKTIGGKVIQVFGTRMGDLTVTGSFGKGRHEEQAKMLSVMMKIGSDMMTQARTSSGVAPIRFLYPPRKWDFQVYLKAFTEANGAPAARFSADKFAPAFTLTLFVVQDTGNLKKVAQDAYISRLADGLGWTLSSYNGTSPASATQTIQAEGGLQQYLINHYVTPQGTSAVPPGTS